MVIRCSFCEVSSRDAKVIIQRNDHSICNECIALVKEILVEFGMGEVIESKGRCSFCSENHGGDQVVFQGKNAKICSECVGEMENEIKGNRSVQSKVAKKLDTRTHSIISSRVKKGVQSLTAYSVPDYKCRVKLDGNESPFSLPQDVLEMVLKEASSIPINRYPDPNSTELRKKISRISKFPYEGILLGNGSDELIEMIMTTFSGGTGRVLYPLPTFSMVRICCLALGLEPIEIELDDEFDIQLSLTLKGLAQKNPDIVFMASPNNPTGNSFSEERILGILDNSEGIVVIDEAYGDFCGKTYLPLIKKYENLVILRTMSKVGFAGIRLGILFGREQLIREINKVRLPYNINYYSQRIAKVILNNSGFVSENLQLIIRERDRVHGELKGISGAKAFPSDANFILFRVDDADKLFRELMGKGILIRNFNSRGLLENCLRVTIGKPEENDSFLEALREILSS